MKLITSTLWDTHKIFNYTIILTKYNRMFIMVKDVNNLRGQV